MSLVAKPHYSCWAMGLAGALLFVQPGSALAVPPSRPAGTAACTATAGFERVITQSRWVQRGGAVERREIPANLPELIRIEERGVHVEAEVQDHAGAVIARAESPLERCATVYVYLTQAPEASILVLRSREPTALQGTITVTFLAASGPPGSSPNAWHRWADGDQSYALGRAVTFGRLTAPAGTARGAFETAARDYQAALDALQGTAHAADRGALELDLAALHYYGLKDWKGAASWGAKAAETFSSTHEPYLRGRAQALQAAAWIELATRAASTRQTTATPASARAEFARARALLTELAQFHGARGEAYDRALQINNIGAAFTYESRFAESIPPFIEAQAEFQRLGDVTRSAQTLQNIGYSEWGLGRLSAAIEKFDRALELMASMERPNLYLNVLNNDGLAHYEAGRLDEALQLETRALDLAVKVQSDQARARSDFGIGVTYYSIGDRALAADFLKRALEIATPELDARLRVDTLRALAQIESEAGDWPEAIAHDDEALKLATASWARARILLHLAEQHAAQGDVDDARRMLDALIEHPPSGDELVRAMARVERARLLKQAGSRDRARSDLLQAIHTFDRFDALGERFEARVTLAQLYADEHEDAKALGELRTAFAFSREIRAQTANPEYRTSIVQSLRPALSLEVDLLRKRFAALGQAGDLKAARAVARESLTAVDAERAAGFEAWRAEYLEQTSSAALAPLLAESSALYRDMAERRFELAVREDGAGTGDTRAQALREDIAHLRARAGVLSAEIARRSQVAAAAEGGAPVTRSSAPPPWPPGQAAIEYWLGTTHAYAWVVKGSAVEWIELPASADIERAARDLHERLRASTPSATRREACAELYRLTLAPLESALVGVEDLTLVPDGSLHYVPFPALLDPTRRDHPYLVQRATVAVAPALRFLDGRRGSPASTGTRMLLVADPIYAANDPRLGTAGQAAMLATSVAQPRDVLRGAGGGPDLARLASSAQEAAQIRELLGAENVDLLEGEEATREAVLARDLTRYRFIHIASHGVIDSEIPQLSALILGTRDQHGPVRDPYLRAADLLTRTFHAQAIVLSACDTALGKEYGSEGLIGLRYAALARGAHSVVATLWPVSDALAATLMTSMYRGLIQPQKQGKVPGQSTGLEVARSLAAAMREALTRAPSLDPALWAPFTVYVAGD